RPAFPGGACAPRGKNARRLSNRRRRRRALLHGAGHQVRPASRGRRCDTTKRGILLPRAPIRPYRGKRFAGLPPPASRYRAALEIPATLPMPLLLQPADRLRSLPSTAPAEPVVASWIRAPTRVYSAVRPPAPTTRVPDHSGEVRSRLQRLWRGTTTGFSATRRAEPW